MVRPLPRWLCTQGPRHRQGALPLGRGDGGTKSTTWRRGVRYMPEGGGGGEGPAWPPFPWLGCRASVGAACNTQSSCVCTPALCIMLVLNAQQPHRRPLPSSPLLAPALVDVDLGAAGRTLVEHLANTVMAKTSMKCSTEVAFAHGQFKYSGGRGHIGGHGWC